MSSRIKVLEAASDKMDQITIKLEDWFQTPYWTATCVGLAVAAFVLAAIQVIAL